MMDALANSLFFSQAAETGGGRSGWVLLAIVVAAFILPFVFGSLIGRALRLRDLSFRIGVILLVITLSLIPFVYVMAQGRPWTDAVRFGIDLAGGTNLVYEIDRENIPEGKKVDAALLDKMVGAVSRRINPSGTEEVVVRRVGTDRIEVIIPGADQAVVEQKKGLITRLGSLEFAILANERDHREWVLEAQALPLTENDVRRGGRVVASWRDMAEGQDMQPSPSDQVATRTVPRVDEKGQEHQVQQFLIAFEPPNQQVTGRYLTRVDQQIDQNGQLAVGFSFSLQGASKFAQLTSKYRPDEFFQRRLAILLDGKIHSAPYIRETISQSGQITGRFTQEEVEELISVLNAGALEVPLKRQPVSEFTISPLLGHDVQQKGMLSIAVASIAVFVFMVVYYLFAGIVADLCLLLNILMVIGAMAVIQAAFTLPGLAGLVLTIGMAVDANVLIYERMREEMQRGSSLRMAIHNGFSKALAPIVDSNVTTLITAVILYMIGSDQIRGFAVTLFIGLVCSMFTAIYVGRVLFDIVERRRWLKKLKMLSFVGVTSIDFLGKRVIAFTASFLLIAIGMGSLFARGKDNLDIDFTGGTMVTFEFVKPQDIDDVRSRLQEKFGSSISLEQLTLTSGDVTSGGGTQFRMRTTIQEPKEVRDLINESFNDPEHELRRVTMSYGEITDFAATSADAKAEADTDKAARPEDEERFAGGHAVSLKFSSGIATATMSEYLISQISEIKGEGNQPKYNEIPALFQLVGRVEAPADPNTQTAHQRWLEMNLFTTAAFDQADLETVLASLQQRMASEPVYTEMNTFAKSVADETQLDALFAMLASLVAIIIYIWFRFERVTYGLAAVAALVHDVLATLGCLALAAWLSPTTFGTFLDLEDFKINMTVVAAILTIIGYSLNDTIVIFDRIREIRGKNPNLTYDMVNLSVNQTLARTLLTSLTVFIVVMILYLFGGEGIHGFAFCMVIGVITGCYSTVFIANPILLWLHQRYSQRKAMA